jgi:D-alanine-D-alanine ligase-like ATP-grasp enzyme
MAAQRDGTLRALASRLENTRLGGPLSMFERGRAAVPCEAAILSAKHDETYRCIWRHAAAQVGASMVEFAPGYFRIRRGEAETLAWRHHVMIDSPATTTLAGDKVVLHQLLEANAIPTSTHGSTEVEEPGALLELFDRAPGEYVVKPSKGTSGGQGVTCGVSTTDALMRAWLLARQWSSTVLVEPQAIGDEFRLLFLEGELLGAVRRRPPCVVGDGQQSVRALIKALNEHRLTGDAEEVARLVHIDLDCVMALSKTGLTLRSVLAPGQHVRIKMSVSENGRTDNETWSRFCPELVSTAARAVAVAGLQLGGVDLVTPDPMRPLSEAGVILEVNATPGFHYHYQVADIDGLVPVAVAITEQLLKNSEASVATGIQSIHD